MRFSGGKYEGPSQKLGPSRTRNYYFFAISNRDDAFTPRPMMPTLRSAREEYYLLS